MRSFFSFVLIPILLINCSKSTPSQLTAFEPVEIKRPRDGAILREEIDFKLHSAGDIPHKVYKTRTWANDKEYRQDMGLDEGEDEPEDRTFESFEVIFGKLTLEDFETLKKAYYDNPEISYDAGRSYGLEDFMPPKIQAMLNLKFRAEELRVKNHTFSVFTNCWTAAYDIVKGGSDILSLFYVDDPMSFFEDSTYSTPIKTFSLGSPNKEERNQDLQPFDVIMIKSDQVAIPAHMAVYIDQDFYFEKTSHQNWQSYRFLPYSSLFGVPRDNQPDLNGFKGIIRRFNKDVKIPSAQEIFSLKARGQEMPDSILKDFGKDFPYLSEHAVFAYGETIDVIADVKLEKNPMTQRFEIGKSAFEAALKEDAFKGKGFPE